MPILPTFQLKPNIQLHRRGGPMCPPGKYRQHFLYSCRGDPRGLPFHVVCDVELTAARAVTTLKNKHFRYSCRGVHCTPADRKRIFPKTNRYDRTTRRIRADTWIRPYIKQQTFPLNELNSQLLYLLYVLK